MEQFLYDNFHFIVDVERIHGNMRINYPTTFECQKAINKVKTEIEQYEKEIRKKEELISQIEERMAEIKVYHDETPIEQRTLKKYITSSTKTVDLLDEFETVNEKGIKKYSRILDSGVWKYKDYRGFQFIIERFERRPVCVGNITMTNYKTRKGIHPLLNYAREQIKKHIDEHGEETLPVEIIFDIPYSIRGQKSSNRRGYGSEYNGASLVKRGTLYGETTNYVVVGVKYIERKS